MIRIGFFGTPSLAATVLSDIYRDLHFEVAFVVTNPDSPFGRDQVMRYSPVKEFAIAHKIPLYQPVKIRANKEFLNDIQSYDCDYYIVVAYGKIMPIEVLESPHKMCINVHGSILPSYRGASPIQAALLNGEKETGVTIMQMSEKMDEGDILKIRIIPIDLGETSGTLFEKFALISGSALIDTLLELEHGGITALPQDHQVATYCKKIEKQDGLIDWTMSAQEIYQKWQAYTPWPGIFTYFHGKRLLFEKISLYSAPHSTGLYGEVGNIIAPTQVRSEIEARNNAIHSTSYNSPNGSVMMLDDGGIGVICTKGILTLEQVKLEGKKSQKIKDFVNGNQDFFTYVFH